MIVKDIIQPVVTDIVYSVTGPQYPSTGYEWLEAADNDDIRDPENEIITIKVE